MAGSGRGRAPGEYISLPPNAASHVDAYFEYRAYVMKIRRKLKCIFSFYILLVLLVMMMVENYLHQKNMKNIKDKFYLW